MALKGNIHAIRMCMDRTNPARKERCIDLELRPISGPQDLPIHFQDITAAVAEGRITPSEGESLANILISQARATELLEADRRLAELEAFAREVQSYRGDMTRCVETNGLAEYQEIMMKRDPDEITR